MKLIQSISEMRDFLKGKDEIGFVPTMGNLHEGHLSLIQESNRRDKTTVVSIYVNPTQFGPREDFSTYPRTLEPDLDLLKKFKVAAVFHPSELYSDQTSYVDEIRLSRVLCGRFRPAHFRGVLTVVLKLFNIIRPQRAYFGRKDYQQMVLIRKMAQDFNLPIEIVPCAIVRASNGLALSSRNACLNTQNIQLALKINLALKQGKKLFASGETTAKIYVDRARKLMAGLKIQYIDLVHPNSLESLVKVQKDSIMAIAAFVGKTRLIDNTELGSEIL